MSLWYSEMADYLQSIDPNHLITTGEEGFYGCCNNPGNPGVKWSEWAANEGQDFVNDHSSTAVSFSTMHSWPDNWQDVSEDFQRRWIRQHVEDSKKALNKPLVLEEWGKVRCCTGAAQWHRHISTHTHTPIHMHVYVQWVNLSADATVADRNRFMSIVFDEVKSLMSEPNSPLQGSLFWQWYLAGQEGAPTEGGGAGLFGIYERDEAFALIKDNIAFIKKLNTPVPGCSPAALKSTQVPPVEDCSRTWVNKQRGTGYEGPGCATPINECVRGTAACDRNAACIDTPNGYTCTCYYGYSGDGRTCTPDTAELSSLKSKYWTEKNGLSCKEGLPVEWPEHSPGWVYDPTKSFAFFDTVYGGKLGSKTNITVEQCMVACETAPTCESFVYNDVLMQCFLARGQCPVYNFCQGEQAKCVSTNDRGGQFSFDCGYWTSYYRLDSDVETSCQGFVPNPLSIGQPHPEALGTFQQYRANTPVSSWKWNYFD